MLEYSIAQKKQFTVMGISRRFDPDTSYQEIPKWWEQQMKAQSAVMGMFGVCIDSPENGKEFEYMIADAYVPGAEIPQGYAVREIPASQWAVFPCRGALPQALQSVNTKVWAKWLPGNKEYCLSMNLNLEMYAPPAEKEEDTYSEIWLPVRRKNEAL